MPRVASGLLGNALDSGKGAARWDLASFGLAWAEVVEEAGSR
jgi:hypothetical protein